MSFKRFSSTYLLALLYIYKTNLDTSCEKFLIPKRFLEEVYLDLKEDLSKEGFRLMIIIELLKRGEAPEKVAEVISWRDFEHLVAKYFEENGYIIFSNYRIKQPRREIDLIAIRFSNLFCIDCKNWNISLTSSSLESIVSKQLERCCFLKREEKFRRYNIYPAIIVMRKGVFLFFKRIPIIPINILREFIGKFEYLSIENKLKMLSCQDFM